MEEPAVDKPRDFIREIVAQDLASGKHASVVTRFPPEPNGYLHIGHAKAICLNFGIAQEFGGRCHLRFDDTNPEAEDVEFVDAIQRDIRWLGFDWNEHLYYASSYFEQLYQFALRLIQRGLAYVCELSVDDWKDYRGVPTRPGKRSPWRDRPAAENLDLFKRMKAGEFDEGRYVLRARIDMASPNLHLRDPAMYRIKRVHHHQTGADWNIYPTYDFAHGQSDSIEGITHSLCSLEFEVHRPLYDWFVEALELPCRPRQIEFARLNLTYTLMSKRLLQRLVRERIVAGWDDPRMPSIAGMRRRGYPPEALRAFCNRIGITKFDSLTDVALLEHCVRDELNRTSPRRLAVLNPLKVVIENYPEEREDWVEAINNPEDDSAGVRSIPLTREVYIERDDFMENPPAKFYRLAPGREVRLRYAGLITCTGVRHDEQGQVAELRCTWDPSSLGGNPADGRKVRGTLHWVSAAHAVPAEVRLYDRMFNVEDPAGDKDGDFLDHLNPDSLRIVAGFVEPVLGDAHPGDRFQFERLGYFCADGGGFSPGHPVFNRTVPLRDSWGKRNSG
jgi:glutaminyl-tRNA synthetase